VIFNDSLRVKCINCTHAIDRRRFKVVQKFYTAPPCGNSGSSADARNLLREEKVSVRGSVFFWNSNRQMASLHWLKFGGTCLHWPKPSDKSDISLKKNAGPGELEVFCCGPLFAIVGKRFPQCQGRSEGKPTCIRCDGVPARQSLELPDSQGQELFTERALHGAL
jgi:predicted nucleic acid-binding Zn ribbon protein